MQPVSQKEDSNPEIERFLQLKAQAVEAIGLLPSAPEELTVVVQGMTSPALLADMVANLLDIKNEDKQDLLETFDLKRRLDKVLEHLGERVGVLRISKEIGDKTKKEFDERQREHVLREQMRQIQKELGEGDETAAELEGLKKAIEDAGMPEDVHKHTVKEFKRLQRMGEAAPRLDAQDLPRMAGGAALEGIQGPGDRHRESAANPGRGPLRPRQDQRRILEHLAVRKLNPEGKSPILCFVGPPGVGKTSLGQSIARATGRKFPQRIALGGVHDEAEIRGHRRPHRRAARQRDPGDPPRRVAQLRADVRRDRQARPGRLPRRPVERAARCSTRSRTRNSATTTSRWTSTVEDHVHHHREHARHHPGPLRDRMEIIQLPATPRKRSSRSPSATCEAPARRQRPQGGAGDPAGGHAARLIRDYTREAGVRTSWSATSTRRRGALAMKIAEGAGPIAVEPKDLRDPGREAPSELAERASVPGVATGLAWTSVGGDILFIERRAPRAPGG